MDLADDVGLARRFHQVKKGSRTLERVPVNASYAGGKPTLREAVKDASLVVVGRVTKAEFEAFAGTHLTVEVQSAVKGPARAGTSIRVWMGGGPFPDQEFKAGTLAIYENAPLLLPGDRALLLLEGPLPPGEYYPESSTGLYNLEGGVARALEANPFGAQVDGLPEAAFKAMVEAEAR